MKTKSSKKSKFGVVRFIAVRLCYVVIGSAIGLTYAFSQPIKLMVETRCASMFKLEDGFFQSD